jgi:hypothetical protein
VVVVNKIKQLDETKLDKLAILAKADGCKDHHAKAVWIIARSPWWKSQGYQKIMEALKENG